MSKEDDAIVFEGKIVESLPSSAFKVVYTVGEKEHFVLAHLSGKMRTNRIRIIPGDKVTVEVSPYDLSKGRITYRAR